ncbi:MAG: UDP-2,3-diacylglucosamine diphosphatase [Azoarcus sp.]|jgi:UDP-2,3-diacylglucosamine hydrolase|nr:UDP-2,3-diacylglucosamine diphosphatase [Azoarcus sp.]
MSLLNAQKSSDSPSGPSSVSLQVSDASVKPELPFLFIADLHLAEKCPETVASFLGFLSGPARQARSVFILGDLFEYWAGDDDAGSAFNQTLCSAIQETVAAGTAIFFMVGNRDVLAGEGFARASGAQIINDATLLRIGERALLLSHGDALCTDDREYQAFRLQARDKKQQAMFLAQPLAIRKAFLNKARDQSETAKRDKRMEIMDVNADAVTNLLRANNYPTLVHGHTHRPARHTYLIDGHRCERYVLPDWHDRAVWLSFDGVEFTACSDCEGL